MSGNGEKQYWKVPRELTDGIKGKPSDDVSEYSDSSSKGFSRRKFLTAAGFATAGVFVTGCSRAPIEKAIPYLVKPEEITPGKAYYYASICAGCTAGCGLLVKNRDGRPIKLEGNPEHPISRGGLCAVGQAAVLELYDSKRLKKPLINGKKASWDAVDEVITEKLDKLRTDGGKVRLLTGTINSPTTRSIIETFLSGFEDARHIEYDSLSASAILKANEKTFGASVLPRYLFENAEVIVSFDSDFLGTWISPVEYTRGYQSGRSLNDPRKFSRHVQFESRMSLTGSNADSRYVVRPDQVNLIINHLAVRLAEKAGVFLGETKLKKPPVNTSVLDKLVGRLWEKRGRCLIVCGSQDVEAQVLCNFMNHLLGNYGSTIDIENPSYQRKGNDAGLKALIDELKDNSVDALILSGVNPVYDLPGGKKLGDLVKNVQLSIAISPYEDETSVITNYVCPEPHFLETWRDYESVSGVIGLGQPAIQPLRRTRSLGENLAKWMGYKSKAYGLIRKFWGENLFPGIENALSFKSWWDKAVHDGFITTNRDLVPISDFDLNKVELIATDTRVDKSTYSIILYPKVSMLDGSHAHNPWLQELPDPITKVTWDNYACISGKTARKLGLENGGVIELSPADKGGELELPVLVQPGQPDNVIAVALGYGRIGTERFNGIGPDWLEAKPTVGKDETVGVNASGLKTWQNGIINYLTNAVKVKKTGRRHTLAITQGHQTLEVPKRLATPGTEIRPIVREMTLASFIKNPTGGDKPAHKAESMWAEDHKYTGHHWGMIIDLSKCTGCSACVISCQAENNIPVVGKDEVRRSREMHWIRIDRYYSGSGDNVEVVHQPMTCHQCDNAPCETICPVLATVHSDEGISQQIYNRCVGTRYCANNCPYKVRRFNWFNYRHDDKLQNLVLNPDITVRKRGVMEKCNFCAQRIQEAKIEAKRNGAKLADTIQPACQQSCPAGAIVFGDVNDPSSEIAAMLNDPRRYEVLGEINLRPSISYLKNIRNPLTNER
ncbi:MAG: 4Fe-4S dicluster domain-containing protein [bacterium]|nr:4Fe-4S dicluster domain-containing protein [bacterium]